MIDTKALRQKVLDLAIRGKLVPQDPNDEPASVLLERIRAQKQQMVKDGKLKAKDIKNDTVIFVGDDNLHYEKFADGSVKCIEDEIPFDLPDGWAWCRLRDIITVCSSKRVMQSEWTKSGVPFYRAREIVKLSKNGFVNNDLFISEEHYQRLKNSYDVPRAGDLMVTGVGTYIVKDTDRFYYKDASVLCFENRTGAIISDFAKMMIESDLLQEQIHSKTYGNTVDTITITTAENYICVLPPLEEQQQIISTLISVIEIIDEIENDRCNLLDTVKSLKSKILDLAIRGQLVPQDPADEPASVLLDRIRAEKEELIKQGKIKRDKKESVIFKGEDNSYYLSTGGQVESIEEWNLDMIPESWTLCSLGAVCDYGNCNNVEIGAINDTDWILDLEDIEKDSGRVLKKVMKKDRNANSTKHKFHKGQVLYSKLRPYLNKVVLADDDGYCTSEILPLKFHNIIVPEYARYYMMSPTFLAYADRCSYGVKMPRLGTPDGKKAVFVVPPVDEQKRIAEAIESAFEQLNSIGATLE